MKMLAHNSALFCKTASLQRMGYKTSSLHGSSLYDRVKKLLVSYEWSDCSFYISGKTFKAHKLILGISSPVFEAMFYGPMSSNENIIITDIEPDIFQLLLNFIYTDNVEIPSIEEAFELLYASKKYLLEPLKDLCVAYVQTNMCLDNVTTILNYPEYMCEPQLNASALKLFCEHADYLLQKDINRITPICMKLILESNQINVKEKDLIQHVFNWSFLYCKQNKLSVSTESRRNVLKNNGLFKLLRFLTLSKEEVKDVSNSENNLLLPGEIEYIETNKIGLEFVKGSNVDKCLTSDIKIIRNSLQLQWHPCHRSSLKSVAPIVIDANNFTLHTKIKSNKPVFLASLSIPTRMAPVLNFRSTDKLYSEQISVLIVDETDNSTIKFTNFINTVEYDSTVGIKMPEPCLIMKDKWYKINFIWPQNQCVPYSYVVEFRDRIYKDHRVTFEFEDLSNVPGSRGSFLCGLKYCL